MDDGLTPEEATRVRAFARRRWIYLGVSLVITLPVAALFVAIAVGTAIDRSGWALLWAAGAAALGVWPWSLWREARAYRDVEVGHSVRRVKGAFRVERTRSGRGAVSVVYFVGSTPVLFADPAFRKQLTEGKSCTVRLLGDGPWLVVGVLHVGK